MEPYKNFGRNSGVAEYEINPGAITIRFKDGSEYLYTNESSGSVNVTEMQRLAGVGRGLNSFINTKVREGYARKIR